MFSPHLTITNTPSAALIKMEWALAHKVNGFILAHNHPSGDPTPSAHDRELTQAVKAAAATVGIRFLDHLIIGDAAPFSFKANGLL